MNLRGYVYDDAGNPVSRATVQVFKYGDINPVASTTTGADGSWVVTGLASGFQYRVKVTFGGLSRWIESRVELQAQTIVGPDGVTAPLPAQSITTAHIQDGAVTGAKVSSDLWAFKNVNVGGTSLSADQLADTLTLNTQGEFLGVAVDAATDTVTLRGLVAQPSTTNFPLRALTERSTTTTSSPGLLVKSFQLGASGIVYLTFNLRTSNASYSVAATVYVGNSSSMYIAYDAFSMNNTTYVAQSVYLPVIAGQYILIYLRTSNNSAVAYISNAQVGYTLTTASSSVVKD